MFLLLLLLILVLVYDMDVSCHRRFLPGTSFKPVVIPTPQASSFTLLYFPYYVWCSKYGCLCGEPIECFRGTASTFFLKLLFTIPVTPVITGTINISGFTFVVSLYTNASILTSYPLPFAQHFCLRVLPHLPVCVFLFFVFIYYIWHICCNFSVCVYCLIRHHRVCVPFFCGFNA